VEGHRGGVEDAQVGGLRQVHQPAQRGGVGGPEVVAHQQPQAAAALQQLLEIGEQQVDARAQGEGHGRVDLHRLVDMGGEMGEQRRLRPVEQRGAPGGGVGGGFEGGGGDLDVEMRPGLDEADPGGGRGLGLGEVLGGGEAGGDGLAFFLAQGPPVGEVAARGDPEAAGGADHHRVGVELHEIGHARRADPAVLAHLDGAHAGGGIGGNPCNQWPRGAGGRRRRRAPGEEPRPPPAG